MEDYNFLFLKYLYIQDIQDLRKIFLKPSFLRDLCTWSGMFSTTNNSQPVKAKVWAIN
jgi:hypothetical protein